MFVERTQPELSYGSPIIHLLATLPVKVDVSTLTTDEVDSKGNLKPGVPLTRLGKKLATQGVSTAAAAVARTGNSGNGTVGSIAGKAGKPTEVITLKATSSTNFNVYGSRSGHLGNATVGTPFTSAAIDLTITAGGNAFSAGDEFSIVVTEAAANVVFGTVIAATKIVPDGPTNDSLAAFTNDPIINICVLGTVNRDISEDNLGRALTAQEIAGYDLAGSRVVLTNT